MAASVLSTTYTFSVRNPDGSVFGKGRWALMGSLYQKCCPREVPK